MKKTTRALTTTLGLTVILFSFIIFLLYVIYCYAYYDKYLEYEYTISFNNADYNFVYEKMVGKGNLTYEQFIDVTNNLSDKSRLEEIFDTYYKNSGLYNKEDFVNTYLFKLNNVIEENVKFSSNGNTNLFTRRAIFYDEIKLSNGRNYTSLGVFNNVSFNVESSSILKVDGKELECSNGTCIIDKIYGGIYEISYISNGYEYYGLVNVNKDKQSINVTNLDSLVKVKEFDNVLKIGRYNLTSCDLIGCPLIDKSYLMINMDNTYYIHKIYKDGTSSNKVGNYVVKDDTLLLDEETFIINGRNLIGEEKDVYSYVD